MNNTDNASIEFNPNDKTADNDTARHMIKTAADLIGQGSTVVAAVTAAKIVKNHPPILAKLNLLKNISILDANTINYLQSIKLTDMLKDVEPKINVLWALVKNAGLVTETDLQTKLDGNKSLHQTIKLAGEEEGSSDKTQQAAVEVLKKLLNLDDEDA